RPGERPPILIPLRVPSVPSPEDENLLQPDVASAAAHHLDRFSRQWVEGLLQREGEEAEVLGARPGQASLQGGEGAEEELSQGWRRLGLSDGHPRIIIPAAGRSTRKALRPSSVIRVVTVSPVGGSRSSLSLQSA